ncbi:MAG: SlyX family protein [Hyphomonas sp.]|nr:SlyX family protein [Hyphomonas sp.]
MTDTTRLDALEIRIVHQDEVIEDLNRTVIAQWKEIDRLSQQLARLTAHVANLAPSQDALMPQFQRQVGICGKVALRFNETEHILAIAEIQALKL